MFIVNLLFFTLFWKGRPPLASVDKNDGRRDSGCKGLEFRISSYPLLAFLILPSQKRFIAIYYPFIENLSNANESYIAELHKTWWV